MDPPQSTLTNLTLVEEHILLFAKFFWRKRFSIRANGNLKEETFLIFVIFKNALFFRKYFSWLEDLCLPVAIVVMNAIKAEILMVFPQQTYLNLSQYDNRLYVNVDDLIEEEQDEVKSRSVTQF